MFKDRWIRGVRAFALATAVILPSAWAAESPQPTPGWYIGGGLGVNDLDDAAHEGTLGGGGGGGGGGGLICLLLPTAPGCPGGGGGGSEPTSLDTEYDLGYGAALVLGYQTDGSLRPEFELAYLRNDLDKAAANGASAGVSGRTDAVKAMGNLWYDIDLGSLRPYLGAGLGGVQVRMADVEVNGIEFADDEDIVFAWQAGAGIGYLWDERTVVSLDYRYLRPDDPSFDFAGGDGEIDSEYKGQSLMVGLRYVFAPAEQNLDTDGDGVLNKDDRCPGTPPGVAVDAEGCPLDSDGDGVPNYRDKCPNTPPGAPVDENGCPLDSDGDTVPDYGDECPNTPAGIRVLPNGCTKLTLSGDKQVNFAFDSATLTPSAKELLEPVAKTLADDPDLKVSVEGHTDSIGSDAYNLRLSRDRAASVTQYLIANGARDSQIRTRGFGEKQPIESNDSEHGRLVNRRVEIIVEQPQ